MKWYADLYVGEQVKGKEKKRIRQITKNGRPRHYYLITYPANTNNLLDIMPVWTAMHYENLHVIGLAKNKREALHVAGVILDEVYRKTGGFAVQAYLKDRLNEDDTKETPVNQCFLREKRRAEKAEKQGLEKV